MCVLGLGWLRPCAVKVGGSNAETRGGDISREALISAVD